MPEKKNVYISLANDDAEKLKTLCQNELGLSVRKGVEQLIQVFIRQPEVRKVIMEKMNETKLKMLEEEINKVKRTMSAVTTTDSKK